MGNREAEKQSADARNVAPGLAELRGMVEAATGPNEQLDAEIIQALFVPRGHVEQSRINARWCIYDGSTDRQGRPRLWEATGKLHQIKQSSPTASLDAVLALVGEKQAGREGELLNDAMGDMASCGWRPDQPYGPQLARYLILALLSALEGDDA